MLLAKHDEAGVILTDEQNDFLLTDVLRIEEIEELGANICLMARIQPADNTYDAGPSYDSAFISEVQSSSNTENEKQMYPTHTKIINSIIGDDQIDSDIIFDSPNGNVNSGSTKKDAHVPDLFTAPAHISSGLGPQLLTPRTISSGLVPQPPSPTPNVPTSVEEDDHGIEVAHIDNDL
ncbi:hypothetical protein Tco_1521249 [Tanacetum coccineum]